MELSLYLRCFSFVWWLLRSFWFVLSCVSCWLFCSLSWLYIFWIVSREICFRLIFCLRFFICVLLLLFWWWESLRFFCSWLEWVRVAFRFVLRFEIVDLSCLVSVWSWWSVLVSVWYYLVCFVDLLMVLLVGFIEDEWLFLLGFIGMWEVEYFGLGPRVVSV